MPEDDVKELKPMGRMAVEFSDHKPVVSDPPKDKLAPETGDDDPAKNGEAPESENGAVEGGSEPTPRDDDAEAKDHGWKPFKEWIASGGDAKEWRDAKTFNIRRDFIGEQKALKRGNELLKAEVAELVKFSLRQKELHAKEIDRLIAQKKAEHTTAIRDGDDIQAEKIDKELDGLKTEKAAVSATKQPAPPMEASEHFKAWSKDNGWWQTDQVARDTSISISKQLAASRPDLNSPEMEGEFLSEITKEMKKRMPYLYPPKAVSSGGTPPSAERSRRTAPESSGKGSGLTRAEEAVADSLGMTHAEYAAQLKEYDDARSRR